MATFVTDPTALLDELRRRRAQDSAQVLQQGAQLGGQFTNAFQNMHDTQRQQAQDALAQQQAQSVMTSRDLQDQIAKMREQREGQTEQANQANRAVELQNQRQQNMRIGDNDSARLQIERENADRAKAQADQIVADKQRADALARVDKAVQAHIAQNGPNADLSPLMEQLAGQPGLESIKPEDIVAAHYGHLIELADKARAQGRADQAADLEKQKAVDEAAFHRGEIGARYAEIEAGNKREQMKLDAAGAKAGAKSASDDAALNTAAQLADRIRKNARGVIGLQSGAASTLKDFATKNNGGYALGAGVVGNALTTPAQGKLETDVADFIEHSVNALENTKRSVSKEQKALIKDELLGAIRSGDPQLFDAKMAEVQDLLAQEQRERGAGRGRPISDAAAGATTVSPAPARANPF